MKSWAKTLFIQSVIGRRKSNIVWRIPEVYSRNFPSTRDAAMSFGHPKTVTYDCLPHALTLRMICRFAIACPVKCRSINTTRLVCPEQWPGWSHEGIKFSERVPNEKNRVCKII